MSGQGALHRLRVIEGGASTLIERADPTLRREADQLEALHGLNPYSHYLRKHGRRPTAQEAATIGRLVGGQVEACDGTMQPPLSDADRKVITQIKARRGAAARRYDHILRLRDALAALSENKDDPAEVIGKGSCLLNEALIGAQLDSAVCWLTRFAREWHGRGKEARSRDQGDLGANPEALGP